MEIKVGQYWRNNEDVSNRGCRGLIKVLDTKGGRVCIRYLDLGVSVFIGKEVIPKNYRLDRTWNTKLRRVLNG